MRIALFVACLALAGCQSMLGSSIPTPDDLRNALNSRYNGAPVEYVFDRYGMPDYQFISDDVRVLAWDTTTTLRHHEPATTITTGSVGGTPALGWADAIPYREATTTRQSYDATYSCEMQVGVKPDGTVDRIGIGGKVGACQNFMP